jgi:hypothetical protein
LPANRAINFRKVLNGCLCTRQTVILRLFASRHPPQAFRDAPCELPGSDSNAVYSEAFPAPTASILNTRFQGSRRAIVAGSWKLITWSQGPSELYDLAADPGEAHNLYRADDPRTTALVDRLQKWAAMAPPKVDELGKQDKNTVEKLKSLGYAQ